MKEIFAQYQAALIAAAVALMLLGIFAFAGGGGSVLLLLGRAAESQLSDSEGERFAQLVLLEHWHTIETPVRAGFDTSEPIYKGTEVCLKDYLKLIGQKELYEVKILFVEDLEGNAEGPADRENAVWSFREAGFYRMYGQFVPRTEGRAVKTFRFELVFPVTEK